MNSHQNNVYKKRNKELYTGNYLKGDVIEYYKNLYESNPNGVTLNQNTFLSKIHAIISILLNDPNIKDKKAIWPPRTTTKDYNDLSQKKSKK